MYKKSLFILLFSAFTLVVSVTSCKKDPFLSGEGVTFSMSNRGIDTKAEYGDLLAGSPKIQMIDWKTNDRIAICCDCAKAESPVAPKQGPVVYKVDGVSSKNNQSIASVVVGEENKFIQWGGNHQHTFYCVYPAPEVTGTVTKTFSSNVVTGSIPETQSQQDDLKPYMLLYGKSVYDAPYEKVDVDFYPLTTCIDFTIKFDVWMKVTDIALVSSDGEKKLSGGFSFNLDSKECTSTDGADKVKVSYEAGGKECTTSTVLSFKLFVKPCDDIVEPYFAVNYIDEKGVARFTKTQLRYKEGVSDESFQFLKSHKTNVTGIIVKEGFIITSFGEPTLIPWDDDVEDNLTVSDEYEYSLQVVGSNALTFDDSGDGLTKTLQVKSYKQAKNGNKTPVKPSVGDLNNTFISSYLISDPSDDYTYTISFTAKENTETEIKSGSLALSMKNNPAKEDYYDLSASGTSNCYVVDAPGTYKFKIAYGNGTGYGSGNSKQFTGTPAGNTPELLWYTSENLITSLNVSEGYITFTVPKDNIQQGNALIALKNGSTITWSWHIWFTDEDISTVPLGFYSTGTCTVTYSKERNSSVVIKNSYDPFDTAQASITMKQGGEYKGVSNRNISTSACTYYQWGRKDPFLVNKYTTDPTSDGYTFSQAVQYPTVWAKATARENDWTHDGNTHYGDLWGSTKTVFDPCPPGYHVPGSYASSIELKKCGYINDSGSNVGNQAKYWTYSSDKTTGMSSGPAATAKDNGNSSVLKCFALCVMSVK